MSTVDIRNSLICRNSWTGEMKIDNPLTIQSLLSVSIKIIETHFTLDIFMSYSVVPPLFSCCLFSLFLYDIYVCVLLMLYEKNLFLLNK